MRDDAKKTLEYCHRCLVTREHVRLNALEICCQVCGLAKRNPQHAEKPKESEPCPSKTAS